MKDKIKRFVIGDIHGQYTALKEVLKLSKFNYKKDKLIVLGDVVDGGKRTKDCIEELLKIKNLVYIIGNHDQWFMQHLSNGFDEEIWLQQGGANTLRSYGAIVKEADFVSRRSWIVTTDMNVPVTHQDFFNRGVYYHKEEDMIFVHGGFDPLTPIEEQQHNYILWDRELIVYAQVVGPIKGYKKVFIGHTTTQRWSDCLPVRFNNLILMDTGAGWNGKLTIMNIDTEKFWSSKRQVGGR